MAGFHPPKAELTQSVFLLTVPTLCPSPFVQNCWKRKTVSSSVIWNLDDCSFHFTRGWRGWRLDIAYSKLAVFYYLCDERVSKSFVICSWKNTLTVNLFLPTSFASFDPRLSSWFRILAEISLLGLISLSFSNWPLEGKTRFALQGLKRFASTQKVISEPFLYAQQCHWNQDLSHEDLDPKGVGSMKQFSCWNQFSHLHDLPVWLGENGSHKWCVCSHWAAQLQTWDYKCPFFSWPLALLSQDHTMSLGCWQLLSSWVPVYSYRLLWLHISSWDNLISKYHQVYYLWSDKSRLFFSFLFNNLCG